MLYYLGRIQLLLLTLVTFLEIFDHMVFNIFLVLIGSDLVTAAYIIIYVRRVKIVTFKETGNFILHLMW